MVTCFKDVSLTACSQNVSIVNMCVVTCFQDVGCSQNVSVVMCVVLQITSMKMFQLQFHSGFVQEGTSSMKFTQ